MILYGEATSRIAYISAMIYSLFLSFFLLLISLTYTPAIAQSFFFTRSNEDFQSHVYRGSFTAACIADSNGNYFDISPELGLLASNDPFPSWAITNTDAGLTHSQIGAALNGKLYYLGGGSQCYVSDDLGQHFSTAVGFSPVIRDFQIHFGAFYVSPFVSARQFRGLFRSSDLQTWVNIGCPPNDSTVQAFGMMDSNQIFVAGLHGLWRTDQFGSTWDSIKGYIRPSINTITFGSDGSIYAGEDRGIFRSNDKGITWGRAENFFKHPNLYPVWQIAISQRGHLFVRLGASDILRSNDHDSSLTDVTPPWTNGQSGIGTMLSTNRGVIAAIVDSSFSITRDEGQHWKRLDSGSFPAPVKFLCPASNLKTFASLEEHTIIATSDSGYSWSELHTNVPADSVTGLAYLDSTLLLATTDTLYLMHENGVLQPSTLTNLGRGRFYAARRALGAWYVGTASGLYYSSNAGATWVERRATAGKTHIMGLTIDSLDNIFAAFDSLLYRSLSGTTWTQVQLDSNKFKPYYQVVTTATGTVLANTAVGLFRSTDNGGQWTQLDKQNLPYLVTGDALTLRGSVYSLFASSDDGLHWTLSTTSPSAMTSIGIGEDRLIYVGTTFSGIWKSDAVSRSVRPQFETAENLNVFPSPATSRCTFSFVLPRPSTATLYITSSEGRVVTALKTQLLATGKHTFEWNTKDLPNGVYLCRLDRAGELSLTTKLVVIH